MEELEAIREAEEAALKSAEAAAEEAAMAAMNLDIIDEEDLMKSDEMSIHTNDEEDHVTTPSTRSLSREKSPEETEKSQSSFKNPTYPLEARKSFEGGMTNSAILRHVSIAQYYVNNGEEYFLRSFLPFFYSR